MLIDDFLAHYDFAEHHALTINASAEAVYTAINTLDVSDSPIIRGLFRLRGMPTATLKKEGLLRVGFIPLGECPPHEMLLGLIGQFWTPTGKLKKLDSAAFRDFNQPGYAKTVWNFALTSQAPEVTRLSTETRILCLDATSRRRFRLYWFIIGPFSALIRREMLRGVKTKVERLALTV